MKYEAKVFCSEKFGDIKTVLIDNEVWFVGSEICAVLEYTNSRKALKDHVPAKYKKIISAKSLRQTASNQESNESLRLFSSTPMGGAQRLTLINEAGLYKLIFASKMPAAVEFSDWVCEIVLPAIRKTGEYRSAWQDKREATKIIRRNLTDAIKNFIGYLKERNELDRPENVWYIIFTKLVNNTLGIKDKNTPLIEGSVRDNLSEETLDKISRAEDVAARVIEAGMIQEKSHHEIHEACKQQLAAWVILDDLKNLFKE